MLLSNEGIKREIIHLKIELSDIKKKEGNNFYHWETNDKYGNKVSIYEIVKKFDEETVTKEKYVIDNRSQYFTQIW